MLTFNPDQLMGMVDGAYNLFMGLLNLPAQIIGIYADMSGMLMNGQQLF